MPKALSIILVNYNVRHFLEQCLYSVQRAISGIDAEVIIVDNNSTDDSVPFLKATFPTFIFIENEENRGFAVACNQGVAKAAGEYILFLNPDTIVPEDCFAKCIQFLNGHPGVGALGVRMIDGSGKFLNESKRAFPAPLTSLFKLFGLARLFPRSRTFARYHLGNLDEHSNHQVDVLAGAFLMVRKEVLEKTGGFDEQFFMYGEDVDLSYRIQQSGYSNYYVAFTSIIHFKGESTKKGSLNYVRMFYNAMSIFVRKHYGGSKAGVFNALIHLAIWIRAIMSAVATFIRKIGLPLIDAAILIGSFYIIKTLWNKYVRPDIVYPEKLLWISFPAFALFYLLVAYYAGLYDRWYKRSQVIGSSQVAIIVLLAAYALLPEQYRFSRAIILFGSLLGFLLIIIVRWLLVKTGALTTNSKNTERPHILVAGSNEEYLEVFELMKSANLTDKVIGRIAIAPGDENGLGNWSAINKLSEAVPSREIVFCAGQQSYSNIIDALQQLPPQTSMKFHAAGSKSIVGSNSRDAAGESFSKETTFRLSQPHYKRMKRLVDLGVAITGLAIFPFQFIIQRRPANFLLNCLMVIARSRTWVGYAVGGKTLPTLKNGVLVSNGTGGSQLPAESLQLVDYWYAKDYSPGIDLKLIRKNYRLLGS